MVVDITDDTDVIVAIHDLVVRDIEDTVVDITGDTSLAFSEKEW